MEFLSSRTPSPTSARRRAISLTKHHGLGNDFLIAVDPPRPLEPADAVRWCDRRRGVGADGLISLTPGPDGTWVMVLHNSDGSRAEVSGNGLRCVGQALVVATAGERSGEPEGPSIRRFVVDTEGGRRSLEVESDPESPTAQVRVDMGSATTTDLVSDRWTELAIPVIDQVGVEIGNPHLVALVDDVSSHDPAVFGPVVEADVDGGVNVHLIDVKDRHTLGLVVWERGAGVTEACGSGACAAAVAGIAWDRATSTGDVVMPGGSATVEVSGDEVVLRGPATYVASVVIDD